MTEQRSDDLLRSRQEAALLLRLDPSNLSASDALRCDLIATLRLSIDSAQADALDGRAADLGRLIVATESLVKLLPSEPPQPVNRIDPRKIMLETYLGMRRRGEIAGPEYSRDAALKRIAELEAEVAALKAAGAPAPEEPSATPPAASHASSNVVPLPRSASTGAPGAPAAPAPPPAQAPAYDYNARSDWKDWVNSDGSIRSTPRGRWDI
jgi:hypothetical protein